MITAGVWPMADRSLAGLAGSSPVPGRRLAGRGRSDDHQPQASRPQQSNTELEPTRRGQNRPAVRTEQAVRPLVEQLADH